MPRLHLTPNEEDEALLKYAKEVVEAWHGKYLDDHIIDELDGELQRVYQAEERVRKAMEALERFRPQPSCSNTRVYRKEESA